MKKTSKISFDGTNLLTRIPKEIEKRGKITKEHKILWKTRKDNIKAEVILYSKTQPELEEDVSDFQLNESAKQRIPKNLEDLGLN